MIICVHCDEKFDTTVALNSHVSSAHAPQPVELLVEETEPQVDEPAKPDKPVDTKKK